MAESWLVRLSTYGLLDRLSREAIDARLEACLETGLVEVSGGQYPVLSLSRSGISVMKGEDEAPLLDWPSGSSV